ncbi:MAG: uroporphyrinogen decarboxylase [Clostridiales Family XIII bacterium]|nr:uroporphyrinogen decarboxylase [Clostridiales Family XIII bacterium]
MSTIEENVKIREDLLDGKIPKRVFKQLTFTLEAACGLAGIDLKRAHYDVELRNKAMHAVCETFRSDSFPIENIRFPEVYQTLRAKNWVMSSTGAMQHPEIESFAAEDYEDYIRDPYTTLVEKILPKIYGALAGDRTTAYLSLLKAYSLRQQAFGMLGAFEAEATQEFGYAPGFFVGGLAEAPFDFLADQLRGFKATTIDVRRIPDTVERAVEATFPLMMKLALPRVIPKRYIVFMPLHLAPYLREKDFARLWWPTFERVVVELHKLGIAAFLFAEVDWTRYADYLAKLPVGTIIKFEYGDAKLIKEKMGDRHIIGGFFDPTVTLTRSLDECLDDVKRLLDIGMPGGRFYFAFNKHVIDINSVDVKKLQAVCEYVHENAYY